MSLITMDDIENGTSADANAINERIGKIVGEMNGNLDSDNLENGAVTREKIADGAVSSAKLGFEKYTDANGWLVTDLGLIKLATKRRSFKTKATNAGATSFVTWDAGMNNLPEGFNPNLAYNISATFYMAHNAGNWSLVIEKSDLKPLPNFDAVSKRQESAGNAAGGDAGVAETWVIF